MPVKPLLLAFVFGMAVAAVAADSGQLQIYPSLSQNATAARRVFTNEHKRPVREIYYRLAPGVTQAKDERDLAAYQVRFYSYDEQGREIWMGEYTPGLILQRSLETIYDATGRSHTGQWREADGLVHYKMMYEGDRNIAHLYFDDSGKNLIGIRGSIPPDVDLASGWGKAIGGIACGLGVNRTEGKPGDIQFSITLRNFTGSEVNVISNMPGNREMKVELRDANGRLVPPIGGLEPMRNKAAAGRNRDTVKLTSNLGPNACETFGSIFTLSEWYADVPAGTYDLTVRRRLDGPDYELVSRPVRLRIVADR